MQLSSGRMDWRFTLHVLVFEKTRRIVVWLPEDAVTARRGRAEDGDGSGGRWMD